MEDNNCNETNWQKDDRYPGLLFNLKTNQIKRLSTGKVFCIKQTIHYNKNSISVAKVLYSFKHNIPHKDVPTYITIYKDLNCFSIKADEEWQEHESYHGLLFNYKAKKIKRLSTGKVYTPNERFKYKRKDVSVNRIFYAIKNNIDYENVPSIFFVRQDLSLEKRTEYLIQLNKEKTIVKNKELKENMLSRINMESEYIAALKKAVITNDFSEIIKKVYGLKDRIIQRLAKRASYKVAKYYTELGIDILLERIIAGKICVFPDYYLYKISFGEYVKGIQHRTKDFNENFDYNYYE